MARYQHVLVNGTDGIVAFDAQGDVMSVLAFKVVAGRITEFYVFADRARLGPRARAVSPEWTVSASG